MLPIWFKYGAYTRVYPKVPGLNRWGNKQ